MSNIYDSANQIEREIRELPEFKALKEAYEKVQANEEAHKLFKDFQAMQIELQENKWVDKNSATKMQWKHKKWLWKFNQKK